MKKNQLLLVALIMCSVMYGQTAPPVAIGTQVYAGTGTIASLSPQGATIKWYAADAGGSSLITSTVLINDATYFVSQTLNSEESTRTAVTAHKISESSQLFCGAGNTVANLASTASPGFIANWYNTPSGGNGLAGGSTVLAGTEPLSTGTYYVEQEISPLQTLIAGVGFGSPIAIKANGKIVWAEDSNDLYHQNGSIHQMDANGSNNVTLSSGFYSPRGIAIQADGKIVVADFMGNTIKRMDADGTNIETLASVNRPSNVAIQADGKILFLVQVEVGNGFVTEVIKRMDADGSNIVTVSSGLNPAGFGIQADGQIVFTCYDGTIKRMDHSGGSIVTLAENLDSPTYVKIQSDGKILFSDNGRIKRMNADGSSIETLWYGAFGIGMFAIEADGKIVAPLTSGWEYGIYHINNSKLSNRVAVNVVVSAIPAAPVATSPQIYTGAGTIANLTATGKTGSELNWYATASDGTQLALNTTLENDKVYYVTQSNSCGESTRTPVLAHRIGESTQTFCAGANVGALSDTRINGTRVRWFNTIGGESALPWSTVLSPGTYYIEQSPVVETVGNASLQFPSGVAIDASGKILIANRNGFIERMSTDGSQIQTIDGGSYIEPYAIVFKNNQIFVLDIGFENIKRIDTNGQNLTIIKTGLPYTMGFAVQDDGRILITNYSDNSIKRMNADGSGLVTLRSGFVHPYSIAIEPGGNILISDSEGIKRMSADGTSVVTLATGLWFPSEMAIQSDGKIVFCDTDETGLGSVKRMDNDGNNIVTLCSGLNNPHGIAIQADGAIVVGDYGNNSIKRIAANNPSRAAVTITLNQIPTAPTATDQEICADYPIVDNLIPTPSASIKWYTEATDGSALTGTTALASGTYYVAENNGTCESTRTMVKVTLKTLPAAPIALNPQIYAGDGTIANLTATGLGLKWYDSATGVLDFTATTPLVDGATYYVSQSVLPCGESKNRTAVTVHKISEATQTFSNSTTVSSLVSTPVSGASVSWYSAANGGSALASGDALSTANYYAEETIYDGTEYLGYGFSNPKAVAVQVDGKIVVSDGLNHAIKRMNADGSNVENLGGYFENPIGVAIQSDGKIVVADNGYNTITRMDTNGENSEILTSSINKPIGVAIQADGKILVAANNGIYRMDTDGQNPVTLGSFFNPKGVAIQSDGKIVVADYTNNAIVRMSADGNFAETMGSGFNQPYGITIQSDGKIVVSDSGNGQVKRMDAVGQNIVTLGYFSHPMSVAIQSDGKILVADTTDLEMSTITTIQRITEGSVSNRVPVSVLISIFTEFNSPFNTHLDIYPNPASAKVFIETDGLKNAQLNVLDIFGKVVIIQNLNSNFNTVNLGNLPLGTYLFKVSNNDGMATYKVVKK